MSEHLIKQIIDKLQKLTECVLHGNFQHLGRNKVIGINLRETLKENGKDHMYVLCKLTKG